MLLHVMGSVFMYNPRGTPNTAMGAALNHWAELREIWYIMVSKTLFHVLRSVFLYEPQVNSIGTPRGALEALWNRSAKSREIWYT